MTAVMLTAQQVQDLLDIDASTVYRMAQDGRLAAIRIGRQWRFPADAVERMLQPVPSRPPAREVADVVLPIETTTALLDTVAHALGVTMVATDLTGRAVTPLLNPAPAIIRLAEQPGFVDACAGEWRGYAREAHLAPRLRPGEHGFLCGHSLVRHGTELVAMVLAGGIAPDGSADPDLFHLDAEARRRVIEALPRTAAVLSRLLPQTV